MNDLVVIDGFEVPAYLRTMAPPVENDFGKAGGFPTISTNTTTTFKIRVDDQERVVAAPLPVVILGITPKGQSYSRAYYASQYVPGSTDPPDCSSENGVAPDAGDNRQCDLCANCPKAVFGSSSTGKGQACAQGKTLYVVPASTLNGTVYQIRVAPTSLKNVATYGNKLIKAGINPAAVITLLGMVPEVESEKTYPILRLDLGGFLNQTDGMAAIERSKSPEITSMIVGAPLLSAPVPPPPPGSTSDQNIAARAQAAQAPTLTTTPPVAPPVANTVTPPAPVNPTPAAVAPAAPVAPTPMAPTPSVNDPAGLGPDSAGNYWDAATCSSGKTKLKDGTWRKKAGLGAAAPPPPIEEPPVVGGSDQLADILNEWG